MVQTKVKEGDLITAEFMNVILDRLDMLEAAVASTGNKMVITFPLPGVEVHLGDELHIVGKGFGVPVSNSVVIDGIPQTVLAGGSDSEIIVKVQNILNIGGGKTVTLTVANNKGDAASTQFKLLPFVQTMPTGSLAPQMTQAPADPKIVGRAQPYQFVFTVKAITNLAEDYLVQATIDQQTWTAQAVNANGASITEISIPKSDPPNGTETQVRVNLTVPVGTAPATIGNLKLTVTSKKNPAGLQNNGTTKVTIDSAPPAAEKINVTFTNTLEGNATMNAGVPEIKKGGGDVTLFCIAFVKQNGKHNVTLTVDNATGWTVKPVGSFTANGASAQTPSQHDVDVTLSASASATETNLNVKVALDTDATVFGTKVIKIRPKA